MHEEKSYQKKKTLNDLEINITVHCPEKAGQLLLTVNKINLFNKKVMARNEACTPFP